MLTNEITNQKWIPGPWTLDITEASSEEMYVRTSAGRIFAQVVQPLRESGNLNGTAHLIAAAPDLAASLEYLVEIASFYQYESAPDDGLDRAIDMALEALRKARGE